MKLNFSFSVRGPDHVSEELGRALSKKGSWEFKVLFDVVQAGLRSKNLARGGDEMLRLRAYEKLQNFVFSGIAIKKGREYVGVPKALAAFFKTAAEFNARFAAGTHCHAPSKPGAVAAATIGKTTDAKTKLPIRKAQKGHGEKGQKGRKAPAQAR